MTSVKPGPCENNAREAIEKHDTPPKGNNTKAGEEFTLPILIEGKLVGVQPLFRRIMIDIRTLEATLMT